MEDVPRQKREGSTRVWGVGGCEWGDHQAWGRQQREGVRAKDEGGHAWMNCQPRLDGEMAVRGRVEGCGDGRQGRARELTSSSLLFGTSVPTTERVSPVSPTRYKSSSVWRPFALAPPLLFYS